MLRVIKISTRRVVTAVIFLNFMSVFQIYTHASIQVAVKELVAYNGSVLAERLKMLAGIDSQSVPERARPFYNTVNKLRRLTTDQSDFSKKLEQVASNRKLIERLVNQELKNEHIAQSVIEIEPEGQFLYKSLLHSYYTIKNCDLSADIEKQAGGKVVLYEMLKRLRSYVHDDASFNELIKAKCSNQEIEIDFNYEKSLQAQLQEIDAKKSLQVQNNQLKKNENVKYWFSVNRRRIINSEGFLVPWAIVALEFDISNKQLKDLFKKEIHAPRGNYFKSGKKVTKLQLPEDILIPITEVSILLSILSSTSLDKDNFFFSTNRQQCVDLKGNLVSWESVAKNISVTPQELQETFNINHSLKENFSIDVLIPITKTLVLQRKKTLQNIAAISSIDDKAIHEILMIPTFITNQLDGKSNFELLKKSECQGVDGTKKELKCDVLSKQIDLKNIEELWKYEQSQQDLLRKLLPQKLNNLQAESCDQHNQKKSGSFEEHLHIKKNQKMATEDFVRERFTNSSDTLTIRSLWSRYGAHGISGIALFGAAYYLWLSSQEHQRNSVVNVNLSIIHNYYTNDNYTGYVAKAITLGCAGICSLFAWYKNSKKQSDDLYYKNIQKNKHVSKKDQDSSSCKEIDKQEESNSTCCSHNQNVSEEKVIQQTITVLANIDSPILLEDVNSIESTENNQTERDIIQNGSKSQQEIIQKLYQQFKELLLDGSKQQLLTVADQKIKIGCGRVNCAVCFVAFLKKTGHLKHDFSRFDKFVIRHHALGYGKNFVSLMQQHGFSVFDIEQSKLLILDQKVELIRMINQIRLK